MLTNIGPRAVQLDGVFYQLYLLSPTGFASLADLIMKTDPHPSALDNLMKYLPQLDPKLREIALTTAMKFDHETATRAMYTMPTLNPAAMFKPEVVSKCFFLMAAKKHPDLTIAKVEEGVAKDTAIKVWAEICVAFPEIAGKEKKPSESPDESSAGEESIGQKSVET